MSGPVSSFEEMRQISISQLFVFKTLIALQNRRLGAFDVNYDRIMFDHESSIREEHRKKNGGNRGELHARAVRSAPAPRPSAPCVQRSPVPCRRVDAAQLGASSQDPGSTMGRVFPVGTVVDVVGVVNTVVRRSEVGLFGSRDASRWVRLRFQGQTGPLPEIVATISNVAE